MEMKNTSFKENYLQEISFPDKTEKQVGYSLDSTAHKKCFAVLKSLLISIYQNVVAS
jgi:hypothetical protein